MVDHKFFRKRHCISIAESYAKKTVNIAYWLQMGMRLLFNLVDLHVYTKPVNVYYTFARNVVANDKTERNGWIR